MSSLKMDKKESGLYDDSLRLLFVLLVAGLGAGACDTEELLKVELPGEVTQEDLADPALAQVLVNSVVADFECAWAHYVAGASNHSDEWIGSSGNDSMSRWGLRQVTADFRNYGTDTCDLNWGHGVYLSMQTARFQADFNYDLMQGFSDADVPQKPNHLATIRAYSAWTSIAFGENFCATRIDGGPRMTPSEVLTLAETRFTEAIQLAQQAGLEDIRLMAIGGRARARLGLDNYQGAIADAEQIPEGFRFDATTGSNHQRRYNRIRHLLNGQEADGAGKMHATVSFDYRDVRWKDVKDPRVFAFYDGVSLGIDGTTPHWENDKHTELDDPNRLASWEEAQMIIAEASAVMGDVGRARTILDGFHTRAGIPPVTVEDIPAQSDVIRHVIEERRREFYNEGAHRLRDHLRWRGTEFNVPFLGEPGSELPNGFDHIGSTYGDATCFPVPTGDDIAG